MSIIVADRVESRADLIPFNVRNFCCCRSRSTITSAWTTRCGSLTPLSMSLTLRRRDSSRGEGDGPSRLCAGRSVETLHLWLFEPGAVEPSAGDGEPPQHRGDLAAPKPEAGLQDHRRLPARQSRCLPVRVPSVRAAVPAARPLWARVAGGGRNPHQGGQQQGPQLYPELAARLHSRR